MKHIRVGSSAPPRSLLPIAVAFTAGLVTATFGATLLAKAPALAAGVRELFDNPRATVREITLAPGAERAARIRPSDELVLFYEEAHYQAVDLAGKVSPRDRKPGTVVWHSKGEQAPTLRNHSDKPVRYFSIALK